MKLKLEVARRIRNISADQMAKAIGVSKDTYIRLERSPDAIRADQLMKICIELDMEPDDLDLFYRLEPEAI